MTIFYVLLAIILTLALCWAYFTAQRLNRLHIRVDSSLQNLAAALDRRAALAEALVASTSTVARAAQEVPLTPDNFDRRAHLERQLSDELAGTEHPLLIDASARIQLAHRFYNDAVTTTRALRTRPLVRGFRLGGNARLPEYFELKH